MVCIDFYVGGDEKVSVFPEAFMNDPDHAGLDEAPVCISRVRPRIGKLYEDSIGDFRFKVICQDEPRVAPHHPDVFEASGVRFCHRCGDAGAVHFDSEEVALRQRFRERDQMISHSKTDFDDERTVGAGKMIIRVNHFIEPERDAVTGPQVALSPLLRAGQLSAVSQVAGRPSQFSVTFQIRHQVTYRPVEEAIHLISARFYIDLIDDFRNYIDSTAMVVSAYLGGELNLF